MRLLKACCWVVPLRIGTLAIGCFQVMGVLYYLFKYGHLENKPNAAAATIALTCAGTLIYGACKVVNLTNSPKYIAFSSVINEFRNDAATCFHG